MSRSKRWLMLWVLCAWFSLGCGLSSLIGEARPTPASSSSTAATPTTVAIAPASTPVVIAGLDQEESLLANVYERVSPSVVFIRVTGQSEVGSGSGFVFDTNGNIITNNHVVEGARRIRVKFSDDTDVEAKLVGNDPDTDLAVIQVSVPKETLKPVALGDSSKLKVGQRALAIGNPFGFERALSVGYISAIGRVIRLTNSDYSLPELIQTDAAINPGNSGGPILDSKGQVIGVATLIFSRTGVNSGVGLAIPVDMVKRVAPELIKSGRYSHPYLGISGRSLDVDVVDRLSLPVQRGVLVTEVRANGPAARAGLIGGSRNVNVNGVPVPSGGDIIIAIDGKEVRSFEDVIGYLAKSTKVGQQIELTVNRAGKEQKIVLTLGERPR